MKYLVCWANMGKEKKEIFDDFESAVYKYAEKCSLCNVVILANLEKEVIIKQQTSTSYGVAIN